MSLVPEYNTKDNADGYGQNETDNIVLWIPPVRPILLPKASSKLNMERLRVFSWKVEITTAKCWSAELFNEILIPPNVS